MPGKPKINKKYELENKVLNYLLVDPKRRK